LCPANAVPAATLFRGLFLCLRVGDMKRDNYITILYWMPVELNLSGNELILFAIIYGFSQDGKSKFKGSIQYLADVLNISKQSTLDLLKKLVKKNLINKYETGVKGHKKCDYDVNFETIKAICGQESCTQNEFSGQESLPQNNPAVKNLKVCGQESLPPSGQESLPHINIHSSSNNNIPSGSNEPPDKTKKDKKQSSPSPPLTESQKQALELSELILTAHRKEFPSFLSGKAEKDIKKKIEGWAVDIEYLIRLDKKAPETIRQVILWVKTPGNFWFHNIESGSKLREKFERLYGQMTAEKGKNNQPPKDDGMKDLRDVVI